jgi:hypothetical protein
MSGAHPPGMATKALSALLRASSASQRLKRESDFHAHVCAPGRIKDCFIFTPLAQNPSNPCKEFSKHAKSSFVCLICPVVSASPNVCVLMYASTVGVKIGSPVGGWSLVVKMKFLRIFIIWKTTTCVIIQVATLDRSFWGVHG